MNLSIRRIVAQTIAGATSMTSRAAMLLIALLTMALNVTAQVSTTTSDWDDLQEKLKTGENAPDVIQLTADVSYGGTDVGILAVYPERSVTLDLNGHTLDMKRCELFISGNLTVKDTSTDGTGIITTTSSSTSAYSYLVQVGYSANNYNGTLTLMSGKISGKRTSIIVQAGSSLTINGGEVSSEGNLVINNHGSFVMNAGEVSSLGNGAIYNKNSFVLNGGRVVVTKTNAYAMFLYEGSSTEINDGTIIALDVSGSNGGYGIIAEKNAEVTIHDGTITAYHHALTGSDDDTNAKMTIEGGTLTSIHDVAIYAPQASGEVTITGGTIIGATIGVQLGSGTLNIQGGTIIGEADSYPGSAVAVIQNSNKLDVDVNISGGTLTGFVPLREHNSGSTEDDLRKINYAITGGLFHSTGTTAINIEDYLNGPFIAGGRFTYSVAQYVAGGCSEYHDSDTDPYYVSINYLADGMKYLLSSDVDVNSISYKKSLDENRIGKHQAWLVPFDYVITTNDLKKFTFYKINMIANSPDPSLEATDDIWVFLTRLNEGAVLHANMPYVYKPKEKVTDYPFTTENATLKAKNTGVVLKTETAEDIYSFYATYDNMTATTEDPFYYVSINGGLSLGNNGTITVGPYRWVIKKSSKFSNTTSYAREMHFYDGESTTDIEAVAIDGGHTPDTVFTLDGRRLSGKPTKKGVYVVKQRKVVIK